jgi:hypothetical protein
VNGLPVVYKVTVDVGVLAGITMVLLVLGLRSQITTARASTSADLR